MDDALIAWRALHFAATIQLAGVVLFRLAIMYGIAPSGQLQRWLGRLFWASLVAALATGLGWLLCVASAIDGTSWNSALADGTVATVMTDTQFGNAWIVRFAAALGLAAATGSSESKLRSALMLPAAAILTGGLAFAGHGASSPGMVGNVHLTSDVFHLLAVAAWIGGLAPFALYLALATQEGESSDEVRTVALRFSNLGLVTVIAIFATGIVNTLYLVGRLQLLATTDYGRLLALKLVIFVFMLAVAAINRLMFVPPDSKRDTDILKRNAVIEVALGVVVIVIVAVLGTMPPALVEAG